MQCLVVLLASAVLLSTAGATNVLQCSGGARHSDADDISISGCTNPPCKLKRKTEIMLEFKLKPEEDFTSLKNSVHAKILGIPFPFIGVDGTNACEQVFEEDGVTRTSCPLKKGQTYVYKNKFTVLEIYPKLKVIVEYALAGPGGKKLLCFQVPSRIVS